jgi:uncharacterized protein
MFLSRRKFFSLAGIGVASTVLATPLKNLYFKSVPGKAIASNKFGALQPDPQGVLDLPAGFEYRILSPMGNKMDDGHLVPNHHDGMAAFAGDDDTTILSQKSRNSPLTSQKYPK